MKRQGEIDQIGFGMSEVQLTMNILDLKYKFVSNLSKLFEQYNIKNNIFVAGRNGAPIEPTQGYYGEVKECSNMDELKNELNVCTQGVRLSEGKIFIGNLYKDLSQVQESTIVDLSNSQVICE